MKNLKLTISGNICGHLWMGGMGVQSFRQTVTRKPRESTFDLLHHLTIAGDFQDPLIFDCELSVVCKTTVGNRTQTVEKIYDLSKSVAAKGLFYEGDEERIINIIWDRENCY